MSLRKTIEFTTVALLLVPVFGCALGTAATSYNGNDYYMFFAHTGKNTENYLLARRQEICSVTGSDAEQAECQRVHVEPFASAEYPMVTPQYTIDYHRSTGVTFTAGPQYTLSHEPESVFRDDSYRDRDWSPYPFQPLLNEHLPLLYAMADF